jgi:hypothetical protein
LRLNTDEMQIEILLDEHIEKVKESMFSGLADGKYYISMNKLVSNKPISRQLAAVTKSIHSDYRIIELENGTLGLFITNSLATRSKPHLREIAKNLGVSILNSNGNLFNTRQLGSFLIREING